jgi:hypothetical protein
MEFEAAASTDLDKFKARGGKIIFTHGTADPIFSALDTIRYQEALDAKYADAASFSRLFLIPGMNHCGGGPATDAFDAVAALGDEALGGARGGGGGVVAEAVAVEVGVARDEVGAAAVVVRVVRVGGVGVVTAGAGGEQENGQGEEQGTRR